MVKTNHFIELTNSASSLMVFMDVSGSLGTAAGKHVIVPGAFFEANARPLFAEEKRESPVDLRYPYVRQDKISLTLAPGLTVDTLPKDADVAYPQMAMYKARYEQKDGIYKQERLMVVGNTIYHTEEYPNLRGFFQKASAQDQEPVMLKRSTVAVTASDAGGKSE